MENQQKLLFSDAQQSGNKEATTSDLQTEGHIDSESDMGNFEQHPR